jgi:hypothetical protein
MKASQKDEAKLAALGSPQGGAKVQKTSIQPRICSKLWEFLRRSLRESFKMELEFFDHTR